MADLPVTLADARAAYIEAGPTYGAVIDPGVAFDAALDEHDRQVARDALLAEADAIEGYTLNHYSGATMLDQILRLVRRDAGTAPNDRGVL